jgi:predicted site-specific integrase-resolvase
VDDNGAPRSVERDLTLQEVADILRINRETARLWVQSGEFPNAYALPHSTGWRVPMGDIQALRERGRIRTYPRADDSSPDGLVRREEAG